LQFFKNVSASNDLPCEEFFNRSDAWSDYCDTTDRFAILSYSIGWRKYYNGRFLIPGLQVFGERGIYEPKNAISFIVTRFKMWLTPTKLFFHNQVQSQIRSFVESGLFFWYRDNYDVRLQTLNLRNSNKEFGLPRKWNFFTYANQQIQKLDQVENTEGVKSFDRGGVYESMKLKEFKIILFACSCVSAGCLMCFVVELSVNWVYRMRNLLKL